MKMLTMQLVSKSLAQNLVCLELTGQPRLTAVVEQTNASQCGTLEQLHVAIEDDKINYYYYMNLHHGWHIACFNAGIDTETYCDYEKLTKLGDDYLIGKWN